MTRSIARPANPSRPTVGVVAAAKRQPSRAALAPPKPRTATHQTRTQRTKTQRDVRPTTLAKTRVVPASKPGSKTDAVLTDATQPRYTHPRTYPRTYRKPELPTSSPVAPVIDVATYRESLLGQTRAVRNVSSTSSAAGVQTAPAGTWLATYQQLVHHNSSDTPTQSGPTSRRRKTKR